MNFDFQQPAILPVKIWKEKGLAVFWRLFSSNTAALNEMARMNKESLENSNQAVPSGKLT
jgi:hypothetical protein